MTCDLALGPKGGRVVTSSVRVLETVEFAPRFEDVYSELERCGGLEVSDDEVRLTVEEALHADTLAKLFFAPEYSDFRYT